MVDIYQISISEPEKNEGKKMIDQQWTPTTYARFYLSLESLYPVNSSNLTFRSVTSGIRVTALARININ